MSALPPKADARACPANSYKRPENQRCRMSNTAALQRRQAEDRKMNDNEISPDDLLDVLIRRAVSGKPSPWPIDPNPKFKWKGSFKATYEAGDKQILLWAIEDCAWRGALVPNWAAEALHDIMFRDVARGRIASWAAAFGPIRVNQQRKIQSRQHMVAVWTMIRKHRGEGCTDWEELFEDVRDKLPIGVGKVKSYYFRMQKFMKKHGSDLCTGLRFKPDRV
jgi:hypothetical protein